MHRYLPRPRRRAPLTEDRAAHALERLDEVAASADHPRLRWLAQVKRRELLEELGAFVTDTRGPRRGAPS